MELTDNILWLLKQAFYHSLTTINDAMSVHGVSTAQTGVLRQLANEPGLSGADLARRGLVERKRDPQHGRILQAYLTGEGRDVAATVVSDAVAAHDQVFGVLTTE